MYGGCGGFGEGVVLQNGGLEVVEVGVDDLLDTLGGGLLETLDLDGARRVRYRRRRLA